MPFAELQKRVDFGDNSGTSFLFPDEKIYFDPSREHLIAVVLIQVQKMEGKCRLFVEYGNIKTNLSYLK